MTLARHSKAMTSQIDKMLPYMCEPVRGLKALSAEDKLIILKALVDNDFNETLVSERCSATHLVRSEGYGNCIRGSQNELTFLL